MTTSTPSRHESAAAAERHQRVLDLIQAGWTTQALGAMAELGLADLLAEGPVDLEQLAARAQCHAPSLQRLLAALTSLELVELLEDRRFALTPAGALLRGDRPDSLADWARASASEGWRNWGRLADSVRSGRSARELAGGRSDFSHLDERLAHRFHRAMTNLTAPVAAAVAERVDFSGVERVVDVGGSHGQLIATLLAAYPAMRGVLFDLEHAVSAPSPDLERLGVAERCERVAGSFFDAVPAGADAYLLKSVLHNWDDTRCATLLERCAQAMRAQPRGSARLLVIERIAPAHYESSRRDRAIARSDLNMLVALSGRERTKSEFRALLGAAGLDLTRIWALPGEFSVIDAVLADPGPQGRS